MIFADNQWRSLITRDDVAAAVDRILEQRASMGLADADELPHQFQVYFSYYGLEREETVHQFGWVDVAGYRIAVHEFRPIDYNRRVILVHGYFDHAGTMRELVQALLLMKCAVVLADLPGHGLSSGPRGDIPDFTIYGRVIAALYQRFDIHDGCTVSLVGHSTGGAAIIEWLWNLDNPFDGPVVLVSPLFRSAAWQLAKLGSTFSHILPRSLPRWWGAPSADPSFEVFARYLDPLQVSVVPVTWIQAMVRWSAAREKQSPNGQRLVIVQGTHDKTVDWRYNLFFLTRVFPESETVIVPQGRHHLLQERETIRLSVIETIAERIVNWRCTSGQTVENR